MLIYQRVYFAADLTGGPCWWLNILRFEISLAIHDRWFPWFRIIKLASGNAQSLWLKDPFGGFHKWVPPNGWFIMENPIEIDDLEVPPFQETSIYLVEWISEIP